MSSDWEWYSEENERSVVVPDVSAIAVYTTPSGEIVIRQQGTPSDQTIFLPEIYVDALISAIQKASQDIQGENK